MKQEDLDAILSKIDKAVGPPEDESPEDREKRKEAMRRAHEAAKIRKATAA